MPILKDFPPSKLVSSTIRITDRDLAYPSSLPYTSNIDNLHVEARIPWIDPANGKTWYVTADMIPKKKTMNITCEILKDVNA